MAQEKKQSIEIWLRHLKVRLNPSLFFTFLMPKSCITQSSAKSSRSSLQSAVSTSSTSKAVRSSAKAVGRGVKRIKKVASSIARPLKRAKRAGSNVSSLVVSNEGGDGGDPTASGDEVSVDAGPEVIEINSGGEETDELEEELGKHELLSFLPVDILLIQPSVAAKKTWRSAVYSFFKPEVTIEVHEGRVAHFFECSAKKCKTSAKGIRRYQDKADKSSTANLRHHATRCFGEDAVKTAMKGESNVHRSGNIFNTFSRQGKQPITYSHRAHSTPKFR